MTEKQIMQGYKDLLRMSSPRYKAEFLRWLFRENKERYLRFCGLIEEEPQDYDSPSS